LAYTESEQGTSSDQMAKYHRELVELLRNEPAIEAMISISSSPQLRQGMILLRLIPSNQRESASTLLKKWSAKFNTVPGVSIYLKNVPLIDLNIGTQVRGAYQYLIQGLDSADLYASADALLAKMRADPIFIGISSDLEIKTPQFNLNVQRDQASALGVNLVDFEKALSLAYSFNRVTRIQTPVDQYDVILELNRDLQRTPESLSQIYFKSSITDKLIPFDAVATITEGVGPASVNHFAQFPAVTLTFSLDNNVPLSEAIDKLNQYAETSFVGGVSGNVKGAAETFKEAINSLTLLLVITIFTIYIVLGILYESFIHPLTILSTLPPAIVGGLLTLFFTGRPLSLYAFLGIILLIGIVKKNGIMMVDFALDNIRTKGETPEKSIYDACIVRFRPIMMTTAAAIMGAIPIALGIGDGAESRRPLGLVIIGGMCVSQLITLFLTPVIYLYMEAFKERYFPNKKQCVEDESRQTN